MNYFSPKGLEIHSIRTSKKIKIQAAIISTNNFFLGFTPTKSSQIPKMRTTVPPVIIEIISFVKFTVHKIALIKAIYIASPPKRAIGF